MSVEIHGWCDDELTPIRTAFAQNFEDGRELGASIAAYRDGKLAMNLWAGHANPEKTQPWQEDTLPVVFSTVKLFTVTCVLMAVDQGLLELDERVARYWPAFGQGGKDKVTVREALTHRALVPGFRNPHDFYTRCDWDAMIRLIEQEPAWFEPGTLCYHPLTYGYILGELVRIVSGADIQQIFIQHLAQPLDADIHMGLTDRADQTRVPSFIWPDALNPFEEGSLEHRVFSSHGWPPEGAEPWSDWQFQSAVLPSEGGFTTAAGLAKFGSMLASGGRFDGREYISDALFREACREQIHAECPLLGDIRFALGFGLENENYPGPSPTSIFWGGYGGSWCFADPANGTAMAYTMNRCFEDVIDDPRQTRFWETYRSLI